MSEYIKREDVLRIAESAYSNMEYLNPNEIKHLPAADVAEVRHGRWVQCFEDWRKQIEGDKCSVCGFEHYGTSIGHYHYCPNCGAKMDKEASDDIR